MAEQDKSSNSPTATCRVFISYSHDSTEHEQRVRALADQLRDDGIDARIDQYVQDPDEGWVKWMRTQVKEAEKALLVFTETYQRRFEGDEEEGKGLGATFEGVIVTQSLYESGGRNAKFRPVVFRDEDAQFIPVELRRFNRYRVDTPEHYQNLLRWLYEAPRIIPPRLGQKANLPPDPSLKLFASKSDKPPVSAPASPPGSAQGAAGPEPAPLGISKTVEIAEGVLTFGSGSWRMSVLLPPFLDKPEITLVPEGWSADKDPVIEEITTDKFTAKISSSAQQGKWIWRASGALLKTHSADAATTSGIGIVEGVLTFGSGSWRMSVLLPPFLDKPKITLVPEDCSADKDPVVEELTTDKFTAKISSSTQQGKWIWRARGPRRESNAESQARPSHSTANDKTTIKEVVLLIHGIRDFAEWQHKVSPILREIPEKEVWPLSYGRFDAVRFWFPIWTRDAPLNKLLWRIREPSEGCQLRSCQ